MRLTQSATAPKPRPIITYDLRAGETISVRLRLYGSTLAGG